MRKILMIGLMLAAAVFFTSCGDEPDGSTPKAEETIVLTVLAGQSTTDVGIEDMMEEVLAEKFPQVKFDWECVDWGEKFDSQIRGRFYTGEVPDIMIGKAQDVSAYVSSGNLAVLPDGLAAKVKESALETVRIDGLVYGLPYNIWYQGVLYNKKIFETYGLEPPQTTAELDHIIAVLREHEITPFAGHYQESWKIANMTMQFLVNDLFRKETDWGERFRAGQADFAGSELIRNCFLRNQLIRDASWDDVMQLEQFESDTRFAAGQAAMYLTGSWSLQFANEDTDQMEFGIFPYPNLTGDACLIQETNMTFMKSSQTEHGELIDEIFEVLFTDEQLAGEIFEFTKTASALTDIGTVGRNVIQDDVERYEKNNQIIDVAVGNSQLIWTFQNDVAAWQQQWLQGKKTLDEVLLYADQHRLESKDE